MTQPGSRPETWRPMAFGDRPARDIHNAVAEPHWGGYRMLAQISGPTVTIRDVDGDEVIGFEPLRDALAGAAQARELVIDGYLVAGSAASRAVLDRPLQIEAVPTVSQLARQMFLGGGGRNSRKEAYEEAMSRRGKIDPEGEVSFVAIDLLWLDGESLLDLPFLERRRLLESALADTDLVKRTAAVRPPVEAWYAQWKTLGFNEFTVKDANSRYTPGGVSRDWTIARIPKR